MEQTEKNNKEFLSEVIKKTKEKRKLIYIISFATILFILGKIIINYSQDKKFEEIAENYIKAELLLPNNKEKSKSIYKEIVISKNKFYSILALNKIIENNLEKNSDEILRLFEELEKANIEKEDKNLVKLKKALYLLKISKEDAGKKILDEIIKDDSIWKDAALEILKL